MDDPHSPATNIDLEIRSKFFQVYSASLQVHAEFSGLRRILYRHPWFSTVVGVSSNMIILSIIILISWTTFFWASRWTLCLRALADKMLGQRCSLITRACRSR